MTVTDEQDVDAGLEAQVRAEFARATWFQLASATAEAHREHDLVRRRHDPEVTRVARGRLHVLELLLAAETDRLHPHA